MKKKIFSFSHVADVGPTFLNQNLSLILNFTGNMTFKIRKKERHCHFYVLFMLVGGNKSASKEEDNIIIT